MGQIFRVSKPRIELGLTSPATHTSGLHDITWDTVGGEGDLGTSGATDLEVTRPGTWLFVLNVRRDAIAVSSEASIRISVSGSPRAGARSPASTTAVSMSCSLLWHFAAAGELVTCPCQLSSGATAGFDETATSLVGLHLGPLKWT